MKLRVWLPSPQISSESMPQFRHVKTQVLHAGRALAPLGKWLLVDGTTSRHPAIGKVLDPGSGNESTGPGNDDRIILLGRAHVRLPHHLMV